MKRCWLVLAFLVLTAAAQEQKQHFTINVSTPEGGMLQAIGQEPDDEKKLVLAQDFLNKYPKHEGTSWVTAQIQVLYVKQKQYDKALESGEKAFATDPNDLDVAYNGVKAAEGKEDADQLKIWAARSYTIAQKVVGSAKPPADDDEKQHLEYVKGVATYSDYALFALAAKLKDQAKVAQLGAALEEQNIKSQYMPQLSGLYLNALAQSGQAAKVCPAAERLAAANSKDLDALVSAANCGLQQRHFDRAEAHSAHLIEALGARPKPEGMSDADWGAKKTMLLGRANWITGIAYASESKLGPADKALRAALPAVKGEPQMAATALFQLGLANYQMGKAVGDKAKIRDGLRFFEQCAAIPGPNQAQASTNVNAIKRELGVR